MNGQVWKSCYTCRDYLSPEKRLVLADRLGDRARREGRDAISVVDEYMLAAHERHLSGQPLRPGGPTCVLDPALGRLAALLSPGLFGSVTTPVDKPTLPESSPLPPTEPGGDQ